MKQIMNKLREIRLQIANFLSRFDMYLIPVGKFILAMAIFCMINAKFGYMDKIAKFPIALILGLFCSFMPMNMIVILGALLSLAHAYALSMECAIVLIVVYAILFLLYFRFSPKDTIAVILTPICFVLKIPYVIPMSFGLVGSPASAVSVACGTIIYYVLGTLVRAAAKFEETGVDDKVDRLKAILEALIKNREMVVCAAAFGLTVFVVYIIRRMSIKYSWTIAMVVGALFNMFIILLGDVIYNTQISIVGLILGTILACIVVKIIQFLVFDVDYSRTEKVQFEDDDYYYYVKAVPKIRARGEKKSSASKSANRKPERIRPQIEEEDEDDEEESRPVRKERPARNPAPTKERVARSEKPAEVNETENQEPSRERVARDSRQVNPVERERSARNEERPVKRAEKVDAIDEEVAVERVRERNPRMSSEDEKRFAQDMAQRRARRESQGRSSEERQAEINRRREEQRRELREAQMQRRAQTVETEVVQEENDDLGLSRRLAYQRKKMEERQGR